MAPPRISLDVISWLDCIWKAELPSASKLIAAYLRSYMNAKHDMAWPSLTRIEAETGLAHATVCKHLGVLEAAGWISRNKGNSVKNTQYIAVFPKTIQEAVKKIDIEIQRVVHQTDYVVHPIDYGSPPNGLGVVHQTDTNIQEVNNQGNTQVIPICAEPQADSPLPVVEEVFICIPRNDGSDHPITVQQVAKWQALYPIVDVKQELRNMVGWCDAKPQNRKTKNGMNLFITKWLSRQQDKGPRNEGNRQVSFQSAADRKHAAILETIDYERAINF